MRIRLKEGKQKELIISAKEKGNLTWKQLSIKLGLGELYLAGEVKLEQRLITEEVYKKLCELAQRNFDNFILGKLEDDWGRSKGGKNSTRRIKKIDLKKSKELAEFMGIVLGDGNLWIKEGGYYYIRISGEYPAEKEYIEHISKLFEKLFKEKIQLRVNKGLNEFNLVKGSKNIMFTLIDLGLKSGDKKANNQGIPEWIFQDRSLLTSCIRGLIDTDGSVVYIKGRDLPYIYFTSNIPKLQEDFKKAMLILGFDTSKWNIRKTHGADCYIAKKEHVVRFLKEVGFHNSKHVRNLRRNS